ncbi:MAG: proton-conducting transporter membrane subunit [Opitutales bacterium]
MDIFISSLILWIAPVLLLWVLLPSSWLNLRPLAAGRFAEGLTWLGFGCAGLATLCWVLISPGPVVATLTDASWFGIRFDALSATILLLVCFLGAVILRFSKKYLAGDPKQGYFFKWMSVTLGAVMALVVAPGLVQFGLAWVATSMGLHKLLVYFPDRLGTLLSARKKLIVSRVGDLCLIGAFSGTYAVCGVQDFGQLFAATQLEGGLLANHSWIGWLIILGALLKSAQFPFHTWLPDTMGAPTPVSALMHAGIINGGGYLVVRLSPVLVHTPGALQMLAICGALTAIYGSMVMLSQTSVKRALAYSTIAQMGFMLLQCGLGAFHLAILHLVAHSLYKGHAFLSSGSAVETAKKLNAKPHYSRLHPSRIWSAVVVSITIVIGLSFAFDVSPSDKPGMLVLSMVVVMALTQLLWTAMRRGQVGVAFAGTAGVAGSIAALYYLLAMFSEQILASSLPDRVHHSLFFESVLAALMLGFLITSIRFQDGEPGFLSVAYKRRLYVHALNGFYMNTLANRAARAIGLMPGDR